jgi:hypothetical protein
MPPQGKRDHAAARADDARKSLSRRRFPALQRRLEDLPLAIRRASA